MEERRKAVTLCLSLILGKRRRSKCLGRNLVFRLRAYALALWCTQRRANSTCRHVLVVVNMSRLPVDILSRVSRPEREAAGDSRRTYLVPCPHAAWVAPISIVTLSCGDSGMALGSFCATSCRIPLVFRRRGLCARSPPRAQTIRGLTWCQELCGATSVAKWRLCTHGSRGVHCDF